MHKKSKADGALSRMELNETFDDFQKLELSTPGTSGC
jgi:hypothetical protein